MLANLDLNLLLYFNSLVSEHGIFFHFLSEFGNSSLLRGLPTFLALSLVVQTNKSPEKSAQILLGFAGAFFAVALSVWCQRNLNVHFRPVFDDTLSVRDLLHWRENKHFWIKQPYSFPSDTATSYFALCMIIFLQNKRLGLLCFLWNMVAIGLYRISMGVHYPSDILAGLALGSACVYGFSQFDFAKIWLTRLMDKYHNIHTALNCICFIFCLEAYDLFKGSVSLARLLDRLIFD